MDQQNGLQPAGFYGRVSGDDDESIESQLMVARETAAKEGWYIPDDPEFVFQDVHISGTTLSRNGFDRLNAVVARREAKFSRLYVRGSNRFGRWVNVRLYDYFIVHFHLHGVTIRFCDVERHIDFADGAEDSDFGLYLVNKVDDYKASRDRTELIRAMKRAKRRMIIRGEYPSVSVPYGLDAVLVDSKTNQVVYKRVAGESHRIDGCKMTLRFADDRRIDAVKLVYRLILEGKSIRKIITALYEGGFPRPRSGKWHPSVVSRIARNPIYFGMMVWGAREPQEWILNPPEPEVSGSAPIVVDGFVPDPPISRADFLSAMEKLSGIRTLYRSFRRPTGPKYLFTGKIRCAKCQLLYSGFTKRYPDRDHTIVYYRHPFSDTAVKRGCTGKLGVRADVFEPGVLRLLADLLADTDLEAKVRAEIRRNLDPTAERDLIRDITKIEKQIAEDTTAMERLQEQIKTLASRSARDSMSRRIDAAGALIDGAQEQLDLKRNERTRYEASLGAQPEFLSDREGLRGLLEAGTFTTQRAVIERVVEAIDVSPFQDLLTLVIRYA